MEWGFAALSAPEEPARWLHCNFAANIHGTSMPRSLLALLVSSFIFTLPVAGFADDVGDQATGKIEKFESGEVVVVKLADSNERVKVRVIGIDCSKKSASAAKRVAATGKVTLRSDKPFLPLAQDQFGRYVAYLELADGKDYGLEMLKSGQCSTNEWKFPHPKLTQYASASR